MPRGHVLKKRNDIPISRRLADFLTQQTDDGHCHETDLAASFQKVIDGVFVRTRRRCFPEIWYGKKDSRGMNSLAALHPFRIVGVPLISQTGAVRHERLTRYESLSG